METNMSIREHKGRDGMMTLHAEQSPRLLATTTNSLSNSPEVTNPFCILILDFHLPQLLKN